MRPSKTDYFMEIAELVSSRSTCLDRQVGCILVSKDHKILGSGYNGAPTGIEHCTDNGFCLKDRFNDPEVCPSAHAEQNAILNSYMLERLFYCYCTCSPCIACVRMLLNTNCRVIIFRDDHNINHEHPHPQFLWQSSRGERSWVKWAK